MTDLYERQLALEDEQRTDGIARYHLRAAKAVAADRQTTRPPMKRLLDEAHVRVVGAIEMFRAEARSHKAGRRHSAIGAFEKVGDNNLLAHMALRVVLDSFDRRQTLSKMAMHLGNLIDDELLHREIRDQAPILYKTTVRRLKETHKAVHSATSRRSAKKAGIIHDGFDQATKITIGMKLIEMVMDTTNLIETYRDGRYGEKSQIYVRPAPATAEWVKKMDLHEEWRSPIYMPMVHTPKPWTSPFSGGYLNSGRVTLVKTKDQDYLRQLKAQDLSQVYSAINALQETAWTINGRVLDIMEHMWNARVDTDLIPPPDEKPFPEKPLWLVDGMTKEGMTEKQLADFTDWKRCMSETHEENRRVVSRRGAFRNMVNVAAKFRDEEAFYFPHQMDFRGRIYPMPLYLNPQGDDHQRGLLTFSNSVPIRDGVDAQWLAVHGAGLWGVDKVSFEEREAWINEHNEEICAAGNDPLAHKFWMDAEKPWQALAFCFEWAAFKAHGYGYESTVPVQMDGSCNGLQNFSAILRDQVGGAAVNLVPADRPSDIYSEVARLVDARVQLDASRDDQDGALARGWVGHVDRKVCKRPVMTLAYGASHFGFNQMVFDDTVKPWRIESPSTFPWEGSGFFAAQYLGQIIWQCVGEVVVAAKAAMGWLQEAAKVATKAEKPVVWRAPSGLKVQQAYHVEKCIRIKVQFQDVLIWPTLREDTDKLDGRRQTQGVAPNWVHSLDAAHMARTINASHALGLRSYSMIHDSYGTHAGNAQSLAMVLREEFVRMYSETDVLADFAAMLATQLPEGAELPPLPEHGSLDLDQVLESQFFFA